MLSSTGFKTVILRQDAAVAQEEVLAAIEAEKEVARQAHEAWKKQRKAERKAETPRESGSLQGRHQTKNSTNWQPS